MMLCYGLLEGIAMECAEIEKEASDRLDRHFISIWEDCDALVAEGIREFRDRWANYSVHSYRKDPRNHLKDAHADIKKETDKRPISELILEVLDPKVSAFLNSLPETHFHLFPNPYWNISHAPFQGSKSEFPLTEKFYRNVSVKYGAKFKAETPLTNLIMIMGFKNTHDSIKQQLRHFMNSEHQCRPIDFQFQATMDNLLELLWLLHLTPTRFKHHSADIKLNARRKQTYCELCGQRNELAEYFYRLDNNLLDPNDLQEADDGQNTKLQLSHRYCAQHRPRNKDGRWNSAYKSALQSKEQFEKELLRLQRYIAKPKDHKPLLNHEELQSLSAEELIDRYFYHFLDGKVVTQEQANTYFDYVKENFRFPIEFERETKRLIYVAAIRLTGAGSKIGSDDIGKIRNIARRIVDSKLTDTKKIIIALSKEGKTQKEISSHFSKSYGIKISTQSISKILISSSKHFK
ncbi:hypothetical protein [Neptunomonas phycophila]|nr:hypothetical protein [Neptunomonas phycophila]